jgi:PAS domain S-box-containing protein
MEKIEEGKTKELILNVVGEGIFAFDRNGNLTFMNPAAVRMLGWEAEKLIGQAVRSVHAILHHSKPDGTPYPWEECPIYAAFKNGIIQHRDNEVLWRKDGTNFPVEFTITPFREEGKLEGAAWVFRDATERKRAERILHESEERFRLLAEGVKDYAIFMLDTDGYIISWNAGGERIKGYKAEEIIGKHFSRFYSDEDVERGEPHRGLDIAVMRQNEVAS